MRATGAISLSTGVVEIADDGVFTAPGESVYPLPELDDDYLPVSGEVVSPRLSRMALASLVVATLVWPLWLVLQQPAPAVAGLAVLMAVLGLWKVRRSAGRLTGRASAHCALWAGILHLALSAVVLTTTETRPV